MSIILGYGLMDGLTSIQPMMEIGGPKAGEGKKSRAGRRPVRVKRDPHPATQSKKQSESLKRLLGRRR